MLYLNVKGVIDNEQTKAMMQAWGGTEEVFSVDTLNNFLSDNPDDPELMLNIDCDGGSVEEGFKIYDALRMSGRTLYTNVTGGCHSMAMVLLLAASAENRSGNRNLRALIHRVHAGVMALVSAEDCLDIADELMMEEEAILDIYEERTGSNRDALRNVMRQEKVHDAESLLTLNFISKINTYNTNQFYNLMSNKLKSAYDAFMDRRNAYRKRNEDSPVVYEYKDAEGAVLFTSEVEPENFVDGSAVTLAEGVEPGEYTLENGQKLTVADGIVNFATCEAEIEAEAELGGEVDDRVEELEGLVEEAAAVIEEQQTEIQNLRNELARYEGSKHQPKVNRHTEVPSKIDAKVDGRTTEDIKAQAKAMRDLANEKKELIKK